MEIRRFLDTLYRRAPVVIVVAAAAMMTVTAAGILIPPVYAARSTVQALWDVGVYDISPRDYVTDRLVNTYIEVLKSETVLEEAIRRAAPEGSTLSVQELAQHVEAVAIPDTDLISISVQSGDPALAQRLANTLATLLVEYARSSFIGIEASGEQLLAKQAAAFREELLEDYQVLSTAEALDADSTEARGLKRQVQQKEDAYRRMLERAELVEAYESLRANSVKVMSPASVPRVPINSMGRREIALSLVIGLCGGIGLALLLDYMDPRIRSPQQAERVTDLAVLGSVPRGLLSEDNPGAGTTAAKSQAIEESYELLSINLEALSAERPLQTVLITSTTPNGERGEVATNLGPVVARSGSTVLLADTDLLQPTLHRTHGVHNRMGLSTVLEGQISLDEAIQSTRNPRVHVLSSGPVPANPIQVLRSPRMAAVLDELQQEFDVIVVDTPPALSEPNAAVLARHVAGVVLLVDQLLSTEEQVGETVQQLQAAGGHMLGIVFVQKGSKRRRLR